MRGVHTVWVRSKGGGRHIVTVLAALVALVLDILLRLSVTRIDRIHELLIGTTREHVVPFISHMSIGHGNALVITLLVLHGEVAGRV